MTECYSARCQQDRKLARREFNKWTKNILLQIGRINKSFKKKKAIHVIQTFAFVGLETISKNHFEFDVNLFNQSNGLYFNNNKKRIFNFYFLLNR